MTTNIPSVSHLLLSTPSSSYQKQSHLFLLKNPNPERLSVTTNLTKRFSKLNNTRRIQCSSTTDSYPVFDSATKEEVKNYSTLREICQRYVPGRVLLRMEELGFVTPTDVQQQALPVLFSGRDCIVHAQTGSGKTLTYLLLIYSAVSAQRSAVQALIVVPTRELGIQVTKVARMLAAKPIEIGSEQKACTVMALLDGGMLKRHRNWLKAEPPTIVVATVASLCQMLDRNILDVQAMRVLVIDEADFMFSSSKQVSSIRKLLTLYSSSDSRQTVFASASIPQHRHFVHDCIQQKWTKSDVVHVHVNPVQPMPSRVLHRFMICNRNQRNQALLSVLQLDLPESAIIFVNEQSEKSKKSGDAPPTMLLVGYLKHSYGEYSDILILEEDMNFNSRAASLSEVRKKSSYLLVATDVAARGVDLPETTHIYNFDLPKTAVHYLHRAGRTGRKPFSDDKCIVTSIIAPQERFVLERFQNELMFHAKELVL